MVCPNDPYTGLQSMNGTRWDPSIVRAYEWPTDKYSVSEDSESVTVIIRYKPWPYEWFKVSQKKNVGLASCDFKWRY